MCNLRAGCRRTLPRRDLEGMLLLRLLPAAAGMSPACRARGPGHWQIVEQDRDSRPFGLERLAHPVVELRSIDPSLPCVPAKKRPLGHDRHRRCEVPQVALSVGWLLLRRLGGLGSGVDDSFTTPSIL